MFCFILNDMNKVFDTIKTWYNDWISVNSWEDKYWRAPSDSVAAGDPSHGVQSSGPYDKLPPEMNIENELVDTRAYKQFNVDGSSMSPERISNGDKLLCSEVKEKSRENVAGGTYVIVKADLDYYNRKNKSVRFDYKLRRTVTIVDTHESFEDLIERLDKEELENSVYLEENRKALEEKFKESHRLYPDFKSMMLSVTYRDGRIRYSFHPSSLIEYKAEYVVSPKKGMNNTRKLQNG